MGAIVRCRSQKHAVERAAYIGVAEDEKRATRPREQENKRVSLLENRSERSGENEKLIKAKRT